MAAREVDEQYTVLRRSLGDVEPTEHQERYLRWLCRWDDETVDAFAGLFAAQRARVLLLEGETERLSAWPPAAKARIARFG